MFILFCVTHNHFILNSVLRYHLHISPASVCRPKLVHQLLFLSKLSQEEHELRLNIHTTESRGCNLSFRVSPFESTLIQHNINLARVSSLKLSYAALEFRGNNPPALRYCYVRPWFVFFVLNHYFINLKSYTNTYGLLSHVPFLPTISIKSAYALRGDVHHPLGKALFVLLSKKI